MCVRVNKRRRTIGRKEIKYLSWSYLCAAQFDVVRLKIVWAHILTIASNVSDQS